MKKKAYNILILEDALADVELIIQELQKGGLDFVFEQVITREDFTHALDDFKPDLILSDYHLPQFDGLSALAIAHEKYPQLPFIFVTRAVGDELAVQTLKNGAADYVLKDKPALLFPAVEQALRNIVGAVKEKELERTKTNFITLTSHQLRTPLTGTKWLIETLRREMAGPMTEKQKEYLNQIDLINEHMIKLVMGILDATSFESSASIVKNEKIPVAPFSEKTSRMMEFVASQRGVVLKNVVRENKDIVIESDRTMLAAVLGTLLENAIDYSHSGQEVLFAVQEDPEHVTFSVKDSGIGISEEEKKKIFERFYRTANAKAQKPDGTGLALYVASLIAKKIGGRIYFESDKNVGTTFFLEVPKRLELTYIP